MKTDHQKECFDRFSADLPEDVKKAIWDLLQCPHFDQELCPVDGQLKIEVESDAACIRYLTLHDVSGVPEGADLLDFNSLSKRRNEYLLAGEEWDDETEENRIFIIRFSHASVEAIPYRADGLLSAETPWAHLTDMASRIMGKYTISETLLNDDEKALLPLLSELTKLCYREELPEPWNGRDFPRLKDHFRGCGFPELIPALERVENHFSDYRRIPRLFAKLDRVKYEPLFRSLWNKIVATQQGYPTAAQIQLPHIKLVGIRRRVTKMMEELGYSGTYPDFYKTGAVKGIRLAESHGLDYFVYGEKRAVFQIHCAELPGASLHIRFFCGTQLLKKNQTPGDILSCMFDTRGRTYLKTLFCAMELPEQLETVLPIADKQVQLKKLTREERNHIFDGKVSSLALFLGFLILGGGFFAILFTPMTMGLSALVLWLDGEPVILSDVPWLQIFLMSWLGFGSLTGALMALINHLK